MNPPPLRFGAARRETKNVIGPAAIDEGELTDRLFMAVTYTGRRFATHRPLIMEKVSKFAGGGRSKLLGGRGLGEIDSVRKVSILIDIERGREKKESLA